MLTVWLIPCWPFSLWKSKMTRIVNFLGTMMVGTTENLNLTALLEMLFSSKMKSGSGLALISLTFFFQKLSHCCSLQSTLRFSLSILTVVYIVEWVLCISSKIFSTASSSDSWASLISLSWHNPIVLSLEITSATTFFLPLMCSNFMLNCCSSNAH